MKKGSERVLAQIKKKAGGRIAIGVLMIFFGLNMGIAMLPRDIDGKLNLSGNDAVAGMILSVVFFALALWGVWVLITGIRNLTNPNTSKAIQQNPELLTMADELFDNLVHQDDVVLISPRVIGNAQDFREMAYTDEVFLAYIYTHRTNGAIDRQYLWLQTARGDIRLNVIRKKQPEKDALMALVGEHCQYVKFGYTTEGEAYAKQMRAAWERDRRMKGKA